VGDTGTEDVVRGDPVLRRRALFMVPVLLALGVVALATLPRASRLLILWLQSTPGAGQHAVLAMLGFTAPFTLGACMIGIEALRRSLQTLRASQFPPPGMRVVRDTPILRGTRARTFGTLGIVLGAALLSAGTMLPILAWRIGVVLRDGCPRAAARHTPARGL